jgi:hypothetical protein
MLLFADAGAGIILNKRYKHERESAKVRKTSWELYNNIQSMHGLMITVNNNKILKKILLLFSEHTVQKDGDGL